MKRLLSAGLLFAVHWLSRCFFRIESVWLGPPSKDPWAEAKKDLRLIVFLNHTSLFEPVFAGGVPLHFLWFMSSRLLVPGADITLKRPFVGLFYKLLSPAMVPITRKRDVSWESFLALISSQNVVMLAGEGRMMRRNGLDSRGQRMSVRGGVGDILKAIGPNGSMILCYSGGLHHIQAPGDSFPRLFQTARIVYERVSIAQYTRDIEGRPEPFKMAVAKDLELRMAKNCPT